MMRKAILPAALIMLIGASAAKAQRVTGATPDARAPAPITLASDGKFQEMLTKVGSDMFIAGQPTMDGLREMRKAGVTTVVNLRTPEEMKNIGFDEAAAVAALGMGSVSDSGPWCSGGIGTRPGPRRQPHGFTS